MSRHAVPKAPRSEALLEPGKIWPVKVMLPDEEIVEEAAPEPTRKELDAYRSRQAVPKAPRSEALLEPGKI